MGFDIQSMKQRAKALMRGTRPRPVGIGIIFAAAFFIYFMVIIYVLAHISSEATCLVLIILFDLIYVIFRNSCKWYSLKVTREEKTGVTDAVAVFGKNQLSILLLGFVKEVLLISGFMLCYVGWLIFFFLFRMSEYVVWDENVNPFKAMGKSVRLLKGHYGELLRLDISFLLWTVLNFVTIGAAGVYVKPYKGIVYAEFYEYLKAQQEMMG